MTNDDMELVRRFARDGSEEAFAALVARHVGLVHSVAMRQVRDAHLAEEITQTVFIILARKAISLGSATVVSGWLCRTARFVSARALTMQHRRQQREQEAFMQSESADTESDAWQQIEPLLEPAMGQLSGADHDAVVLRFFEGRNFRDVGDALGTSEAAAKMRVNRALGKLWEFFAKRGVVLPVAVIAATVTANSVQAAPVGLAASVSVAAAKGAAVSSSTTALIDTTIKLMAWTKLKAAVVVGTILVLTAGTATVTVQRSRANADAVKSDADFAGYATPEATVQSSIWAGSRGYFERFLEGCTVEQTERFRNKMAGKSAEEIKQAAMTWARAMTGYKIDQKDVVSADEVHLHLSAPPSAEGLRNGNVIVVMKKIGNDWKQAGDL